MTRSRRAAFFVAIGLLIATMPLAAQKPASGADPLDRRISVSFESTDLATALARLRTIHGVPLAYASDLIPARPVSLAVTAQPVSAILDRLLAGTDLTVIPTAGALVLARATAAEGARAVPLAVATGVQRLDQIVVMGTPVQGAPEREQPNAVSVVRAEDLEAYHYTRTADLIRTALPGVVLWDRGPSGPPAEIASVRGASSFTARGIKTYVDGVELATPTLFTLIDPRSIERIEVIRGPQGAALYGSDAINGVVHITTRKGHIGGAPELRAWASASAGPFDRASLGSTFVRQSHAGAAEWGGASASFLAGGNLDRVGTTGAAPNTRSWGVQGGGQLVVGSLLLRASARATAYDFMEERATLGNVAFPAYDSTIPSAVDAATIGVTAIHQTNDHWVQTLVLGYDRARGALGTGVTPLATLHQPLGATHELASRASLRFSSALDFEARGARVTGTVGFEHANLDRARGSWETADRPRYTRLYGDVVNNTGTFLQGKAAIGSLVLSAGARTEWNSSFGPDFGVALASSLGASWARPIGETGTLRFRAGWGRGIRPPEPGMSRGMASAFLRQEPNETLAPEVQAGVELGVDVFGGSGTFARVTLFDQRATDLIQSVIFPSAPGTQRSYQYQNVGAIRNRGIEIETGFESEAFGANLQLYHTTSRIERLSRTYSGYLSVGDPLPEIPSTVGAARIHFRDGPVFLSFGTSFIGPWTGYDWAELARVAASLSEARPAVSDYLISYPAVVKPYFMASFQAKRLVDVFFTIDNVTNSGHFERHNGNPPAGRSVLFGLEFRP
ncbi:MAG: TonB-dependent receptor [Gemmatimonadales bacterium]